MNWFERFFLKRIFNWACKKVDGHKTKLGGTAMILSGAALFLQGIANADYDNAALGVGLAGKGLEGIGLAGKLEKQTAVLAMPEEEKRRLLQ